MRVINYGQVVCIIGLGLIAATPLIAEGPPISDATQDCIFCHTSIHPGIVADWKRSRHSKITPMQALQKSKLQRRISIDKLSNDLGKVVVGCAECHTINSKAHKETVARQGRRRA